MEADNAIENYFIIDISWFLHSRNNRYRLYIGIISWFLWGFTKFAVSGTLWSAFWRFKSNLEIKEI